MKLGILEAHSKVSSARDGVFWSRIKWAMCWSVGTGLKDLVDECGDDEMGFGCRVRRNLCLESAEKKMEALGELKNLSMEGLHELLVSRVRVHNSHWAKRQPENSIDGKW